MSLKEIEKLRERLQKDSNSKLYIPLAEEYRKVGMLDEAIEVLQNCIEKQPGYMSARVSLGKIYIEKDQKDEARIEFEQVIKSIPDNLYALKKLAEIYRDSGQKELAIKMLRTLLKLNPMDEDALNRLMELEKADKDKGREMPETAADPLPLSDATLEDKNLAAESFYESPDKQQETAEPGSGFDSFKASLFGLKDESPEEAAAVHGDDGGKDSIEDAGTWSFDNIEDKPEDKVKEESEIKAPEEGGEEWSFSGMEEDEAVNGHDESSPESEEVAGEPVEGWSVGGLEDVSEVETQDGAEAPDNLPAGLYMSERFRMSSAEQDATENIVPDNAGMFEEIYGDGTDSVTGSALSGKPELLKTAEKSVLEEEYSGAIDAYRQILAVEPGDTQTLQLLEELRSLLKLLGRDKEMLISKLNSFLNSIRKRGDEFFRSA
jgi:tetratricopeptide (TPR) repeat protein